MENKLEDKRAYRGYIYQLGKLFWKNIETEWNEWLASEKISISEHIILEQLYTHGELAITELSRVGIMHISTALNFSKRLEKEGYLEMKKQMKDRRVTHVKLTKKGKEKVEQIELHWNQNDSPLMEEIAYQENIKNQKLDFSDLVTILQPSDQNESNHKIEA